MKRREFIRLLVSAAAAMPLEGSAQQAESPARVGVLLVGPETAHRAQQAVLIDALHRLGWTEGKDIVLERRFADNQIERLGELVRELLARDVKVLVASSFAAARYAKQVTSVVPIVMIGGGDPVSGGLVQSLSRPGGNVTGLSFLVSAELGSKRLQLLKEVFPRLSRVEVLLPGSNPPSAAVYKDIEGAGRTMAVESRPVEVHSSADVLVAYDCDPLATGRAHRPYRPYHMVPSRADHGIRGQGQAASDLQLKRVGGGWRPHVVWA
jgi:putative ABC transport system substrate-binding protein